MLVLSLTASRREGWVEESILRVTGLYGLERSHASYLEQIPNCAGMMHMLSFSILL